MSPCIGECVLRDCDADTTVCLVCGHTMTGTRELLDEATEALADCEGYVGDYLWRKFHYDELLTRLRAALAEPLR